jgi:hypothetical protein
MTLRNAVLTSAVLHVVLNYSKTISGQQLLLQPHNHQRNRSNGTSIPLHNHNTSVEIAYARQMQTRNNQYYWQTRALGNTNVAATLGNPMRGLVGNALMTHPGMWFEGIPGSLHGYKLGLNEIMNDDPDNVGEANAFNWKPLDDILETAEQFRSHLVLAFHIDWPGQPLALPKHLVYNVRTVWQDNRVAIVWDDPNLQRAIRQFLQNLARRYDGDTRIFVIHAGMLGMWGEWHAGNCEVDGRKCLPDNVLDDVTDWYTEYFTRTKISFRYPENIKAFEARHGFNDGSFTWYTVSGPANGGEMHDFYFYNMSVIHGTDQAYKNGIIGGEVRPENSHVFSEYYPSGTKNRQDFQLCSDIAHVTYMEWGYGFHKNGVIGNELAKARVAHTRMGYNFILQQISVKQVGTSAFVDVDATIKQIGFAPFYYALYLDAFCKHGNSAISKVAHAWIPNDKLDEYGETTVVALNNIPATTTCLDSIQFQLGSTYTYDDRPILWSQGKGQVRLVIPLPPGVPASRSEISRRRRRPRIPFIPQHIRTDTIGRCFVVCAQSYCGNRQIRMGEIIRGVSNGDRWNVVTTGNLYSIRCEVNDSRTKYVMYSWPGMERKETSAPWILGGHIGNTVFPVSYFKEHGHLRFTIQAYNGWDWLGFKTIHFIVDP